MRTSWRSLSVVLLVIATIIFLPTSCFASAGPSITTQPQSQSVVAGSNAAFTVGASGQTPLFYQWSLDGTNLTNNAHINGATSTNLHISNVVNADAGNYRCVVTNTHGNAPSSNAILTVLFPASITTQPTNRVVLLGGTTVFSVTGVGTEPLVYQWQKDGTDLVNDGRVSGATNPTLTISAIQMSDAGGYRLVLSNAGGVVTSPEASLSIVPIVAWGYGYDGETNVPLTLSNAVAIAAGDSHYLALRSDGTLVGWGYNYYGQATPPDGLSNVVSIAAGAYHSLALKDDGTVVGWGYNGYGQATPLTGLTNVVAVAAGDYHSMVLRADGSLVAWGYNSLGQGTVPYSLSNAVAIAAGGDQSLALRSDSTTYVWGEQHPPVMSNVMTLAAGKFNFSYALQNDYTILGWGGILATLPPGLTKARAIAAGAYHSLAARLDGTVVSWGGNPYYDFGQTNTPAGLSNVIDVVASYYGSAVLVSNPSAPDTSPPRLWQQPLSRTTPGASSILFNLGVSGAKPLKYQWYFNSQPMPAQTNKWLQVANIQPGQAGIYYVVVTNNYGSLTSQVANVVESPGITMQPTNQTVFQGSNAIFSVSAIGNGQLSYSWQSWAGPPYLIWTIPGETNTMLVITNAQPFQARQYRVIITNIYGAVTSDFATLTVLTSPVFTQQPRSQTNVLGNGVTFSATVSGTQPISFQWFCNGLIVTSGGRFSISSGATGSSLTITGLQTNDTGSYFLVASNLVGITNSFVASLIVVVPPSIIQQPADQSTITGSNAIFNVVADGSEPLAYQWRANGLTLSDGGQIRGAKTPSLTISNLATPGTNNYSVVITNFAGSVTSAPASLIVYGVQITGQPLSRFVQLGSNTSFTVTAIGQAPLSYQWYFNGAPLADDARLTGSATATLNISDVQVSDGGGYRVAVTNPWSGATSATALLTPQPDDSNAVLYVSATSTNPQPPYLDWSTAATNIQNAVDTAINGNLILVTNGVYNSGGGLVYAQSANRVALTKAVTLLSVNGPDAATIVGDTTMRGVYVGSNAVLSGFTITNGRAISGGGIWCEASGVVTNCLISGNTDGGHGGAGVYGGTIYNCTITRNYGYSGAGAYCSRIFNSVINNNSTVNGGYGYGAGAYQCILSNCLVVSNTAFYNAEGGGTCQGTNYNCVLLENKCIFDGSGKYSLGSGGGSYQSANYNCILIGNLAESGGGSSGGGNFNCLINSNSAFLYGGGVYGGTHYNCTIVNNSATNINGGGGGAYQAGLFNSIIYFNSATNGPNWLGGELGVCCTTPSGYITSDPLFVDQMGGNFRLQTNSPCINAGSNLDVTNSTDLDGNPRIFGIAVDIGAYEYHGPMDFLFHTWLGKYGLPTDGSADYVDSDGDGMNNWQEWIANTDPTISWSVLRINGPFVNQSGVWITWQNSGRTYFLQRSTNLAVQPAFLTIASNLLTPGSGFTRYTDTSATNGGPYFYRVGVQVQ